jgi:hypothetical protein
MSKPWRIRSCSEVHPEADVFHPEGHPEEAGISHAWEEELLKFLAQAIRSGRCPELNAAIRHLSGHSVFDPPRPVK